jgi:hypothetical protein
MRFVQKITCLRLFPIICRTAAPVNLIAAGGSTHNGLYQFERPPDVRRQASLCKRCLSRPEYADKYRNDAEEQHMVDAQYKRSNMSTIPTSSSRALTRAFVLLLS